MEIKLSTTKIEHADIHLETDPQQTKIAVISDLHVGQFEKASRSGEKTYNKIKELVEKEHPTALFMLGDIISFKVYHALSAWTKFYKLLEALNIPIYVIPGNHDRYMHRAVKSFYDEKNVHLYNVELLRVFVPGYQTPLIFGHDLKNDKRIHGVEITRKWIHALRTTFHDQIPDESLMFLGHLHDFVRSTDKLTTTVMPFSNSLENYMYTTITPEKDSKFNVRFSFLQK